ncbi:MAG TPA: hypothetical protein VFJ74_16560 [Gemmatimonadaceae bacterium]|nr:hypothetical protein [Gemmatimonadaceae bacterium]
MREDSSVPRDDAAFPFPALVARAGSTDGPERDAALAALMAVRLAADLLLPRRASPRARAERAAAARRWLAALVLPAASRIPLARLADASAGSSVEPVIAALTAVLAALRPLLDAAAVAEVDGVVERVSGKR